MIDKPQIIIPEPLEHTENSKHYFDQLLQYDNYVIFSPHLDDAIASMGGMLTRLAEPNKKITIVNIFTQGSSLQWGLTEALIKQGGVNSVEAYFALRTEEDKRAFEQLNSRKNITIKNLGLIDAPWRSDREGRPLYHSVLDPVHPEDRVTMLALRQIVTELDLDENAAVFLPLGRGRHVDHLITRSSLSVLFPNTSYYTDFPYSIHHPNGEFMFIDEHELTFAVWRESYAMKRELLLEYQSQYPCLFRTQPLFLPRETLYFKKEVFSRNPERSQVSGSFGRFSTDLVLAE